MPTNWCIYLPYQENNITKHYLQIIVVLCCTCVSGYTTSLTQPDSTYVDHRTAARWHWQNCQTLRWSHGLNRGMGEKVDLTLHFTNLPAFLAARFWFLISSCLCLNSAILQNMTLVFSGSNHDVTRIWHCNCHAPTREKHLSWQWKLPSCLSTLKPVPLDHGAARVMEHLDEIDEELIDLLSCHRPATCRQHGKAQCIMLCIFWILSNTWLMW